MAAGKNNLQVTTILPRDIVMLLDQQADSEIRTRSQMMQKIIIEYFRLKEKKEQQEQPEPEV